MSGAPTSLRSRFEALAIARDRRSVCVSYAPIQSWSLTSLQQRLFTTEERLIRHARRFILQLA
jgi:hypothetical protein